MKGLAFPTGFSLTSPLQGPVPANFEMYSIAGQILAIFLDFRLVLPMLAEPAARPRLFVWLASITDATVAQAIVHLCGYEVTISRPGGLVCTLAFHLF